MNCPRCTRQMTVINPQARVCHGCGLAQSDVRQEACA